MKSTMGGGGGGGGMWILFAYTTHKKTASCINVNNHHLSPV
jgi:hypothetical protein